MENISSRNCIEGLKFMISNYRFDSEMDSELVSYICYEMGNIELNNKESEFVFSQFKSFYN